MKPAIPARKKGIALITVLMVTLVMVILTATLVISSLHSLNMTVNYRDKAAAQEMARAGVSKSLFLLGNNLYHSTDFNSKTYTSPGYFEVTFDPTKPWYSVNNLPYGTNAPIPNFRGETVRPGTAELVITARVNKTTRRYHVVIRRGLETNRALVSMRKINFNGTCNIRGIKSLDSNIEIPGAIHSNHITGSPNDKAITWNTSPPGSQFHLNASGMVTCVSGESSQPISQSIHSVVAQTQINEKSPEITIPEVDVQGIINNAQSAGYSPPPGSMSGGVFTGSGQININAHSYINGNYKIIGDLNLNDGILYVNGNLNVTGAIRGVGSIYVAGDTTLKGDTAVATNQSTGATIFCNGNVTMSGLDSEGFLDYLAAFDSTVAEKLATFKTHYQNLENVVADAEEAPSLEKLKNIWDAYNDISRFSSFVSEPTNDWTGQYRLENCPAPDGHIPYIDEAKSIPQLILAIKNSPVAVGHQEKTDQVIRALEKVAYQFRSGVYRIGDPLNGTRYWDDIYLPIEEASIDRQYRALQWKAGIFNQCTLDPGEAGSFTETDSIRGVRRYLDTHPTDMSWVGNNYFQGVVYSRGNLTVSNGFRLIGVVMVHGEVTMNNGAELVFDEEYCNFISGTPPMFRIVSWEEISNT